MLKILACELAGHVYFLTVEIFCPVYAELLIFILFVVRELYIFWTQAFTKFDK